MCPSSGPGPGGRFWRVGANQRHADRLVPRRAVLVGDPAREGHALALGRALPPELLAVLAPAVVPVLGDPVAAHQRVDTDGAVRAVDASNDLVGRACGGLGAKTPHPWSRPDASRKGRVTSRSPLLICGLRGAVLASIPRRVSTMSTERPRRLPGLIAGCVVSVLGRRAASGVVRLPGRRDHVPRPLHAGVSSWKRNRRNALSVTEQLSSPFTSSTAEVSLRCAP